MWLICLALLFWVSRMILKTRRGEMDDDPIVFALKDRVSLVTGVACAVIIAASI
jgi:4-hydroxybenzoate polyprenyltransferase